MKRLLKMSGLIAVFIIVLTGCGKQPIYNVQKVPVALKQGTSSDAVYKAIKVAGASKGWIITKTSEGIAKGQLNIRKHQAVVTIAYDATGYSIVYASSINLDSDGATIHSNYNGWIGYLKQAIDVQLSTLSE